MLSIVGGLHWGALGVAISFVCAKICLADPLLYWYVGRRGPVRTVDFYRSVFPVAAASVSGALASLAFRAWLEPSGALAGLAGCAVITGTVTLAILLVMPAGRQLLADVSETVRLLVGQPKKAITNT